MKNHSASASQIVLFSLLIGFCFLSSCQTYQYGYWGKLPNAGNINFSSSTLVNDTLQKLAIKKQTLATESLVLSNEMSKKLNRSEPIPMHTFNLLFGNLHDHYQIDTVYHQIMQQTADDTIRQQIKQTLLESALNYKKAFQRNKFIRRTINRGDIAYGIPAFTLTQTQQFLWSDKKPGIS